MAAPVARAQSATASGQASVTLVASGGVALRARLEMPRAPVGAARVDGAAQVETRSDDGAHVQLQAPAVVTLRRQGAADQMALRLSVQTGAAAGARTVLAQAIAEGVPAGTYEGQAAFVATFE